MASDPSGDDTDRIDWNMLVEELAPLEHQQWRHWTENLAEREDLPDRLVDRWGENWVPYKDLDEETKDHDRKWAEEAVQTVYQHIQERSVGTDTGQSGGS